MKKKVFYRIPRAVYENKSLLANAKLTLAYLIYREEYQIKKKSVSKGDFVQSYLHYIADAIGMSKDSVRKIYIPQLIKAGYLKKKTKTGLKGTNISTTCEYSILWENIE